MSDIHVSIGPAMRKHRLRPSYDDESDILAVSSEFAGEWPVGVDIDGVVVFDLDSSRVLVNFDIHVGKRRWRGASLGGWPGNVASGSLVFMPDAVRTKSFHLPLGFLYDKAQQLLRVQIGAHWDVAAAESVDGMLMLSADCIALLRRDGLSGFLIRGV